MANLFNPVFPERPYLLNLKKPDEHKVAELLVTLSCVEPGTNIEQATYNGEPFDLGAHWVEAVPSLGFFACTYVIKDSGANPETRHWLCNKLLLPGARRLASRPAEDWMPNKEAPEALDQAAGDELAAMELGADGGAVLPAAAAAAAGEKEVQKPELVVLKRDREEMNVASSLKFLRNIRRGAAQKMKSAELMKQQQDKKAEIADFGASSSLLG